MKKFDFTGFKCVNFNETKWIKYEEDFVFIIHNLYQECYYEIHITDSYDEYETEEIYSWYIDYNYEKHKKFQSLGLISELERKGAFIKYKMVKYKMLIKNRVRDKYFDQDLIDKLYELIDRYANMGYEQTDLAFRNIGIDEEGEFHFIDLITVKEKKSQDFNFYNLEYEAPEIFQKLKKRFA